MASGNITYLRKRGYVIEDQMSKSEDDLVIVDPKDAHLHVCACGKRYDADREAITEDTTDGYHTFKQLYEFCMLYNAEFFNLEAYLASEYGTSDKIPNPIKSKRHSDGELCFGGGWFVVVIQLPTGQVSNHYEMKDWHLFQIDEVEKAPKWDGHTPEDVANRLRAHLDRTS
jgi:hypothetical protein